MLRALLFSSPIGWQWLSLEPPAQFGVYMRDKPVGNTLIARSEFGPVAA
ncbi:MAG: hypothetical protein ACR2I2_05795 [Bryobacteraceae bacterium]